MALQLCYKMDTPVSDHIAVGEGASKYNWGASALQMYSDYKTIARLLA